MPIHILKNPVARKRFSRFKSMRRAYVSLWIIGVLYGLSLTSELICNNVPLVVRYDGRFYFPLVSYASEDVFTGSGRQTRPDFKMLEMSDAFRASGENYMIFPLFPYGPFESMDPKTVPVADEVVLTLTPEPGIGELNIRPDLTVERSHYAEFITGNGQNNINGQKLDALLPLPDNLIQSIARRFSNQDAPYAEFVIEGQSHKKLMVSLSTFRKRNHAPETIRLTFRELVAPGIGQTAIAFHRSLL
ncbi:MAG: hypothetical protein Q7U02_13365, partial [Desulfosalsimonadaceae bacterium]|nr:hypothetical protein [Desulfosalsimonadaceae bacterium]